MKVNCTRGFGIVEHPETGEEINVEEAFETDQETFNLLDEHYPGFEIVDGGSGDETPGEEAPESDESEDYPTNGDGNPLCVGKEDGQCSRTVEEPGGRCWQHPADE